MIDPITADQMQGDYLLALYKRGMVTIHKEASPSARRLIKDFAASRGVAVEDLLGPRRTQPIVSIRQDCMAMVRRNTDLSYPQIGRFFSRDHTTVMHSIKASERRKGN